MTVKEKEELKKIIVEELTNEIKIENTLFAKVFIAADYRDTPEQATNKKIEFIASNIIAKMPDSEIVIDTFKSNIF